MMNRAGEKILLLSLMIAVMTIGSRFGFARNGARAEFAAETFTNLNDKPVLGRLAPDPPLFMLEAPQAAPTPEPPPKQEDVTPTPVVSAPIVPAAPVALPPPPPVAPVIVSPPPPPPPPPPVPPASTQGLLVAPDHLDFLVFKPITTVIDPVLSAESGLVADLETGETYFTFRPDRRWPIASITKLMTAVVATETLNPGVVVSLTPSDFPPEDTSEIKRLEAGSMYSVEDLLAAMLTVSSNEAAEALANGFGRADFLARMNNEAALWSLSDTHFSDPTGLSAVNQSTVTDLKILAKNIYDAYPHIFDLSRRSQAVITELTAKKNQILKNINQFAGETWFLGGKTGYTDESKGNLLTVFKYGGRPVVAIVLGTEDRFGETQKLISWFENNYRLKAK